MPKKCQKKEKISVQKYQIEIQELYSLQAIFAIN